MSEQSSSGGFRRVENLEDFELHEGDWVISQKDIDAGRPVTSVDMIAAVGAYLASMHNDDTRETWSKNALLDVIREEIAEHDRSNTPILFDPEESPDTHFEASL